MIRRASAATISNWGGNHPVGRFLIGGDTEARAVVVTLTVKFCGVVPFKVTEDGLTEQLAAVGVPLQAKLALPLNPEVPLAERL